VFYFEKYFSSEKKIVPFGKIFFPFFHTKDKKSFKKYSLSMKNALL